MRQKLLLVSVVLKASVQQNRQSSVYFKDTVWLVSGQPALLAQKETEDRFLAEAEAALLPYIHVVGKSIHRWWLLCQGNIFLVAVSISGPRVYGASCSDVGLDTGTCAEVLWQRIHKLFLYLKFFSFPPSLAFKKQNCVFLQCEEILPISCDCNEGFWHWLQESDIADRM